MANTEKDRVVLTQSFHAEGWPDVSQEAARWINGNTRAESRADRVINVNVFPSGMTMGWFIAQVWYYSD